MTIPILAYHKVQNDFDLTITRISPVQFERQINFLAENDFSTISITEYLSGSETRENKIVITFDDAYDSIFKFALPILSKYKFTATIFVITNFVGKSNIWDYGISKFRSIHCDWGQLRELANERWEIGSHTITHRNLRALPHDELRDELRNSKLVLEDKLGQRVDVMSYPYGKFDDRVIAFVQQAGYKGACTLGGYDGRHDSLTQYRLPRRGVYLFEPIFFFQFKVKNSRWTKYDDLQQKLITTFANGAIMIRNMKAV